MYYTNDRKNILNKNRFGKYLFVSGLTFFCKRTYLVRNIHGNSFRCLEKLTTIRYQRVIR